MNGTNGESTGKGTKALCPVCYKKLKRNVKFDTVERMKALIEVCTELNFNKEANLYKTFLAEAEEYKKTLPPKPVKVTKAAPAQKKPAFGSRQAAPAV